LGKADDESKKLGKPLNNRKVGEIGIGVNPKATIIPNILEAEKAYKTCHIAFGSDYDNKIEALIHLDHLIRDPTIDLISGGVKVFNLMKEGELKV